MKTTNKNNKEAKNVIENATVENTTNAKTVETVETVATPEQPEATGNNQEEATTVETSSAKDAKKAEIEQLIFDAIEEAQRKLLEKAEKAEKKAENIKPGTLKGTIVKERKNLKSTLQAVQNIANDKAETVPEVLNAGTTKDKLFNRIQREEAIKNNAKITACQKILKGLNIDREKPITCKTTREAASKIYDLCPAIVETEGKREIASLKKMKFSSTGCFKAEYYYIVKNSWETALTDIFITNNGQEPEHQVKAECFTTLPTETTTASGPIYTKVNNKYLRAKEETAKAVFNRYEALNNIEKRLTGNHNTQKASEFSRETEAYTKKKV